MDFVAASSLPRRRFLALAGAAAASAHAATVEKNGWRLRTDLAGNILSLRRGDMELVAPGFTMNAPTVSGPARLTYSVSLAALAGRAVALEQTVKLEPAPGDGPVRVEIPRPLRLPSPFSTFAPLREGIARRIPGRVPCAYEFAGSHALSSSTRLAIPMVSESAAGLRLTVAADPYFSLGFGDSLTWTYSTAVPLPAAESRTIRTIIHSGDERSSIDRFYSTALRDVRPGPVWLHDIAMVGYDFLSKNGRGWFADIDTLERLIPRADRHKVLLALHGWYDYCGRYSFDFKSGALDRRWTAFPNARGPEVQRLAERPDNGHIFYWPSASIRALQPVEMTIDDLHHRLRYARSRGFRAALYFADGLNACDGIAGFEPSKVLRWGGWTGPETRGKSYTMNPLHPEVNRFFPRYLAALLNEFGSEVDGFVWDETFYVQGEDLGNDPYRGYAGRAMMRLVEELTTMTGAHGRDLAFFVSDDLGLGDRYQAPYALLSHGTYQDSGCDPKGWPYGLFPNFRNTLWSCLWAPMRGFDRTEYAADVFDVPVAISNGYAEDLGVSDMNPAQIAKLMTLFNRRKSRRMEITWVEEQAAGLTYRGRTVRR